MLWLQPAAGVPDGALSEALRAQAQIVRQEDPALRAPGGPDALGAGVASFYQRRDFQPTWVGHPDRMSALRDWLLELRGDGLEPAHYGLAALDALGTGQTGDAGAPATREWALTRGFLRALLHLYRGKLDPHDLDAVWNIDRRTVDVDRGLELAIAAVDSGQLDVLAHSARPQHPIYEGLRDRLQRLREIAAQEGWPSIADGPTLGLGDVDPRVPALRRRLLLGGYGAPTTDTQADHFDTELDSAVRLFQEEQYLEVDGRVGPATRGVLNIPVEARIDQLRANLERARWMLHDLPGDFVLVDIAGFRVHYVHEGVPAFTSRIQVGLPFRRTPIFRAQITHLTLNPRWVVPPTILKEDILPRLSKDPGYLARNRLGAFDASGNPVDTTSVEWSRARSGEIFLRQEAGLSGALGRIAIRFPNSHAVYLHETPHTGNFAAPRRAFSSGCIRVEHPFDLAERLLAGSPVWDRAALDAAVSEPETIQVDLPHPVPILLMYWTVDLRPEGRIGYKPDLYQLDGPTLVALDRPPDAAGNVDWMPLTVATDQASCPAGAAAPCP